jgi:hypothetical protein
MCARGEAPDLDGLLGTVAEAIAILDGDHHHSN